jgi:hypothetical protein
MWLLCRETTHVHVLIYGKVIVVVMARMKVQAETAT